VDEDEPGGGGGAVTVEPEVTLSSGSNQLQGHSAMLHVKWPSMKL
jgi:hypothetical protein